MDIVGKLRAHAASQQTREGSAKPSTTEITLPVKEYLRHLEIQEAAHVVYELLTCQKDVSLSQFTVDSVIERLRKALGR